MDNISIGKKLAEIRKQHGFSQTELADILNVSNKLISKWECGLSVPCAEYLLVYSSVFKISIDEIVNTNSEIINATRDNTSKKRYNITLCMAYLTALIPAMIALIAHYILPELIPMH